jgi:hypothetical protein
MSSIGGGGGGGGVRINNAISQWMWHLLSHWTKFEFRQTNNLVPRACDPREGTRGSGIIRFREESDWPLKWNA